MGMVSKVVDTSELRLGNNEYESGVITLAAGAEAAAGACLKRGTTGAFTVASGTDVPVAICPSNVKNEGAASADIGLRVLIGGRVRRDKVTYGGAAITDAQADSLRDYGIIAVSVHDLSQLDNM